MEITKQEEKKIEEVYIPMRGPAGGGTYIW